VFEGVIIWEWVYFFKTKKRIHDFCNSIILVYTIFSIASFLNSISENYFIAKINLIFRFRIVHIA
jgi:hypothetical protein